MVCMKVIDKAVINLLVKKYKSKGHDIHFKVKHLDLPYDQYMMGRSCAKLLKQEPPLITRVNGSKSSPVYKTRFGDIIGKTGKIFETS